MSMTGPNPLPLCAGLAVLAAAWLGPLPALARASYAAHMSLHMAVVAIGVPLVAAGLAGLVKPEAPRLPLLAGVATLADFVIVWGWHAPALHAASRDSGWVMALEQGSFAVAAFLLWMPALAGPPLAGMVALFMTGMHMSLLGVLIGLAPRSVHAAHASQGSEAGLTALQDQQLGGVIMIAVAGAVYGLAALWLATRVLHPDRTGVR